MYLKTGLSDSYLCRQEEALRSQDWVFATPRSLPRRLFQHDLRSLVVVLGKSRGAWWAVPYRKAGI